MFNLLLFVVPMLFGSPRDLNEHGNKLYNKKDYGGALEKYKSAQVKDPRLMVIDYNMGCARYKVDSLEYAMTLFTKIMASLESKGLKEKACYNMGNTLFKSGNLELAIESYKQALRMDPDDKDAKINLEFAQKMLEQQKQQQKDKKDQDKQNQDKKQNQQQKEQQNKQDKQQQQDKQNQEQQKQNAQNILKSLEQDEKDAKQKSQQKNAKVGQIKIFKDW
ncbi:MAG: tetratricopeptide repeat protein [bacterium]|nr:tetratricopeptide repeat protein [bacterium]